MHALETSPDPGRARQWGLDAVGAPSPGASRAVRASSSRSSTPASPPRPTSRGECCRAGTWSTARRTRSTTTAMARTSRAPSVRPPITAWLRPGSRRIAASRQGARREWQRQRLRRGRRHRVGRGSRSARREPQSRWRPALARPLRRGEVRDGPRRPDRRGGGNESGAVGYPARIGGVLGVGAVDSTLARASFSNTARASTSWRPVSASCSRRSAAHPAASAMRRSAGRRWRRRSWPPRRRSSWLRSRRRPRRASRACSSGRPRIWASPGETARRATGWARRSRARRLGGLTVEHEADDVAHAGEDVVRFGARQTATSASLVEPVSTSAVAMPAAAPAGDVGVEPVADDEAASRAERRARLLEHRGLGLPASSQHAGREAQGGHEGSGAGHRPARCREGGVPARGVDGRPVQQHCPRRGREIGEADVARPPEQHGGRAVRTGHQRARRPLARNACEPSAITGARSSSSNASSRRRGPRSRTRRRCSGCPRR